MIIGLTGKNCAGKDTAAQYLQKKGFHALSLSDVIRDELASEGREITRETLIAKANKMRSESGAGILAKKVMEKVDKSRHYTINSIRNPEEVNELRKLPGFKLVNIKADEKSRFERMKKRAREGDPRTFDAFLRIESAELANKDPTKQQLEKVMQMADEEIANDSTLKLLHESLDLLLAKFSSEFKPTRPTWDEYFMSIAKVISSRSNCMKRKVGAVIVRDKRIVSTGYNGTPRGVKNCNEGGCPRCNSFADSGTRLDECICSHGEENAIVQAAYHGISIRGGTIYTTFSPCLNCTKMILNSALSEVVYNEAYSIADEPMRLLKEAGVIVRKVNVGEAGK